MPTPTDPATPAAAPIPPATTADLERNLAVLYAMAEFMERSPKEATLSAIRLANHCKAQLATVGRELSALRDASEEARELIGEFDDLGTIPRENLEALRSLLWRATIKRQIAEQKGPRTQ